MPQVTAQNYNLNQQSDPQEQNEASYTSTATSTSVTWQPEEVPQLTVDVYRQENIIYIVSTVAGVSPKDLDISIENNTLSIKGLRKKPYPDETNVLLEECFWGEFYRELTINENIDVEGIKATINHGILVIEVPLLQITPHRKIQVEAE
jgi:HSP20 family protein